MQTAEIILNVIQKLGKEGKPLTRIYRQLFNENLYLQAYSNLYANSGALTKGTDEDTIDGMSIKRIKQIIELLRYERFSWKPVRRTFIPKKNGGNRPLGIPSWSDKLVQEVIRMILEAYYEPQFSNNSHGFRPERSCHTALEQIKYTCGNVKWFIEGDISKCFDSFNHEILIKILERKIQDGRFINLISDLLSAGYIEDWKWNKTYSGTPQGGVISPLLSNIYLNELDDYISEYLIPKYTRGKHRQRNPKYRHYQYKRRLAKEKGDKSSYRKYGNLMKSIPSRMVNDPEYRRLRYIRYADDFILAFIGPQSEAKIIKAELAQFISEVLKLELSESKTLITHSSKPVLFLGYNITVERINRTGAHIALRIPEEVLNEKCARYMKNGKPHHRPERLYQSDYDIIRQYDYEYRGYVNYYILAINLHRMNKLRWVMLTSMLKTLANKHKTRVNRISKKLKTIIDTPKGQRTVFRLSIERKGKKPLVATFGNISLSYKKHNTRVRDEIRVIIPHRTQLIDRLLAEKCEMCGSTHNMEVHHIRKLADLEKKPNMATWKKHMIAMRRKTLVVCYECHVAIHNGKPRAVWNK